MCVCFIIVPLPWHVVYTALGVLSDIPTVAILHRRLRARGLPLALPSSRECGSEHGTPRCLGRPLWGAPSTPSSRHTEQGEILACASDPVGVLSVMPIRTRSMPSPPANNIRVQRIALAYRQLGLEWRGSESLSRTDDKLGQRRGGNGAPFCGEYL